ncbi:MAG: hypothetical protein PsegKO_30710 [Pseudohongiellaceae bacterium]
MKKFWIFGPAMGVAIAALLTLIFTLWNWVENPGGIFHDASGTHWRFVYDTAASWFLPTLIPVTIAAALGHIGVTRSLMVYRKYFSGNSNHSDQ